MKKSKLVTVTAPAKVNFYLKVLGKRADGYHDIVSLMQALELGDLLTITRTDGPIEVVCGHPGVPAGPRNIAYKAAEAVLKEAGVGGGVTVAINKRTPVAAGLGGGSSDAAAVLKGIDLLFGLGVPRDRMREIARSIGADVPFFLSFPTALAEGVGERLTELPSPEEIWLVLVNPGFEVSTGWVYSGLNLGLTNRDNSIKLPPFKGQALNAGLLVSCLHNDLERVTAGRYPQINDIKERLLKTGAKGALMSGSGPTVFGVFEGRPAAEAAAGLLAEPGLTVLATRTISAWPEPVSAAL